MTICLKVRLVCFIMTCCGGLVHAQQGFFADEWKARSITAPAYNEVQKPTGTANANVLINTDSVVARVLPTIYGNNANPYMTQIVSQPVLIDHIRNLAPNIIRFPGGNISSVYFWNADNGAQPAEAPDSLYDSNGNRVKAYYWYGNNQDDWTISVENYYKTLEQTNSTGIITTNYSYARYGLGEDPVADAAHLAAEWVRYDRGRTKYWEIGNEDAGPWQAGFRIDTSANRDGQPQIINGGLYGRHFKVFADSMRKAAAELGVQIYIGAQLIQVDAANSWNPPDRTWNAEYFSAAGNDADYYIIHSYYTPFAENTNAANILRSAADETRLMMNWMKTTTALAGVEMKPIALTEWNIFAEGSMQSVSHINGLHATLVLGELISNRYGLAARWDLANGWSNGNDHGTFNIGDEPGGVPRWNPRPSFFHMHFFQRFTGDEMLQSTVTGNSDIVSYVSRFSSGQLGAVLVNKGTSAQHVRLQSPGFPVGRYYWYTLTGDSDNGEFSRKVLINGNGPSGVAGGPLNYASIRANSAVGQGNVSISVPPRAAVYVLLEEGEITSIPDIDPANRLIQVYPNPAVNGRFSIRFEGLSFEPLITISLLNSNGQLVDRRQSRNASVVQFIKPLSPGLYNLLIETSKGRSVKKLIVR